MPRFTVTLRTFLGAASHPAAPEAFALIGVGRTRPAAFAQARAALLDACHAAGMAGRAYPACRIGEIDSLFASACDTMGRKRPGAPACPRAFAESASKAQSVEIERDGDPDPAPADAGPCPGHSVTVGTSRAAACAAPRDATVSAPAPAETPARGAFAPVPPVFAPAIAPAPARLYPAAVGAIETGAIPPPDGATIIGYASPGGTHAACMWLIPEGLPHAGCLHVEVTHYRAAYQPRLCRDFATYDAACRYIGRVGALSVYRRARTRILGRLREAEAVWLSLPSRTDAHDEAAIARNHLRRELAALRRLHRETLDTFALPLPAYLAARHVAAFVAGA